MSIDPSRTPVIVGIGQSIERDEIVSPADLASRAARAAFDDAPGLSKTVQRLTMVGVLFSHAGRTPATDVANQLDLAGVSVETTTTGGNTPQWLVTRAAKEIAEGKLESTLIVGAEATRSQRASGKASGGLFQSDMGPGSTGEDRDPIVGSPDDDFMGAAEMNGGLMMPSAMYPVFESAIAAAAGRSFAEQRAFIGRLYAKFSEVASRHPYAWFKEVLSADDIANPSASNRMIAEPYTKRMNAFPNVDQGSALLVTSLAVAQEAELAGRCVFIWSGADTAEVRHPAARPELGRSPAIAAAAKRSFEAANISVDDVSAFDFYSCFPSAVEAGAEAVGLALDDSRGLTVTGGLSYFGGPGNNYVGHSIATMVDRLRGEAGIGLITGLGGFITKHSVGIYGSEPPPHGFKAGDTTSDQKAIDASALNVATTGEGTALVEGATITYDKDGETPTGAPVIARLDDGTRVVAVAEPELLNKMPGRNLVGERVTVSSSTPPVYRLE